MLHLAIICIVCAVSAPSEGTELIGLKKNDPNIFCHFEEQKVVGSHLSGPYNVDVNNFDCVTRKITNRTSSFFYQFIIKQYQNSRSSCSSMENVTPGKEKKFISNMNSGFKMRKLLWKDTSPEVKIQPVKRWWKKKEPKTQDKNSLCCEEKKMFLRLKKVNHKRIKRNMRKRHLDKVKVDDELDMNKIIEKLVKQIALENQRTEESSPSLSVTESVKSSEQSKEYSDHGKEGPVSHEVEGLFPFFNNIKRIFRFSKETQFNHKKINNHVSPVPVKIVRDEDPVANAPTTFLKTLGKSTRFRRNYKHDDYGSYLMPRYRRKYYPSSANLGQFSLFRNKRKYPFGKRKRRRQRKAKSGGERSKDSGQFFRRSTSNYNSVESSRAKRDEVTTSRESSEQHTREEPKTEESTTPEENTQKFVSSSESTNASTEEKDEEPRDVGTSEGSSEESDSWKGARGFHVLEHTLERPFLKQNFMKAKLKNSVDSIHKPKKWSEMNDSAFQRYRSGDLDLPDDDNLTLLHYLKIRHGLRNYLTHNDVWVPGRGPFMFERRKRCGGGKCSMPQKCWRSAPLLCIPYIRKGQDELLKYLIRAMQKMLGKPFPQKVDIFEKTKFKPCKNTPERNCEDIMPNEQECQTTTCPPTTDGCEEYTTQCPTTPKPCVTTPRPCPTTQCPTNPPTTTPVPTTNCPTTQCPTTPRMCPCPVVSKQCSCSSAPAQLSTPFAFPDVEQIFASSTYYFDVKSTTNPPETRATVYSTVPFYHTPVFPTVSPYHTAPTPHAALNFEPMRTSGYMSKPTPATPRSLMTVSSVPAHPPASTINACSWYISKSPVDRAEYFSFTAFPVSGCSPTPHAIPLHQVNQKRPSHSLNGYNEMTSDPTSLKCELCSPRLESMTPWPTISSVATNEPYEFDNYDEDQISDDFYNEFQPSYSEHFLPPKKTRHDKDSERKIPEFNENFKKNNVRRFFNFRTRPFHLNDPFAYEQDLRNENKNLRYPKRPFNRPPKFNFRPFMEPPPNYDYDLYRKYPFIKPYEENNLRYNSFDKYQMPWPFQKKFNRRSPKSIRKNSSKRQKRGGNYYSLPEDFENYDDYVYDSNYNEQYQDPRVNSSFEENMMEKIPDASLSEWVSTPPALDMFSELAKAMTQIENTTKSTTTTSTTQEPSSTQSTEANQSGKAEKTSVDPSLHAVDPLNASSKQNPSSDSTTVGSSTLKMTPVNNSNSNSNSNTGLTSISRIKEKESESNSDLDLGEEEQMPTTVKTASIVKGMKKLLTKPCPKIYTKVYPDSLPNEEEKSDFRTTTATSKPAIEIKTTGLISSPKPDVRLQLLAVCEGYLEVVKLIKSQNQTLEEELDADLSRYCENIISQSFNSPADMSMKCKKQESIQFSTTTKSPKTTRRSKASLKLVDESKARKLQNKLIVNILTNPVYKRELQAKIKNNNLDLKKGEEESGGQVTTPIIKEEQKPAGTRKGKRKQSVKSRHGNKHQKRYQRREDIEDELVKKGMSDEQVQLLQLLRKRKRALMSWLYNTKEDQIKPDDLPETEYFDDEEIVTPNSEQPLVSGTITPKRKLGKSGSTTKQGMFFVNDSIYPVYAKQYGYDKGGELREVEVLWRKLDEKTHEKKVFKNLSVLALFLTSTNAPSAKASQTRLVGNNGYDSEVSETQSKSENKVGFADFHIPADKKNTTETTTTVEATSENSSGKNSTITILSKPDPSSIVGTPPNATTSHPNTTRKISHKLGAAKDLFQEYTIEFLNYAVYILPIMFTLLFLICCMCCFLQILKKKRTHKKRRKKKKKEVSTDDEETTETTDSELELKKKRRETKHKKQPKKNNVDENLSKKRSKTIWNVLKLNSGKPSSEFNDEQQTEKKRSFLRFLKGKKDEGKGEELSSLPYNQIREHDERSKGFSENEGKKHQDSDGSEHNDIERGRKETEKAKTDDQDEANERRELIALLEELKKIETENVIDKKEKKSVYVQYMTQEEDNSVFKRPDVLHPWQKDRTHVASANRPFCEKHFPFQEFQDTPAIENYEMYEDAGELTELIPCDCNYFSRKNDYLRHSDFQINREGRCERFFKIFRDSGGSHRNRFREMNFMKSGKRERSFLLNKNRDSSANTGNEYYSEARRNPKTDSNLADTVFDNSPFSLPSGGKNDILEGMENLKRQLNKKKYVRLKDNGVLCRLGS